MSKRTWICVSCRKAYFRKKSLTAVECPRCHGPCECVHWASRVPSPKQTKAWDEFIVQHKADKARLEADERAVRESPEIRKSSRPPKISVAELRVPYLESVCTEAFATPLTNPPP